MELFNFSIFNIFIFNIFVLLITFIQMPVNTVAVLDKHYYDYDYNDDDATDAVNYQNQEHRLCDSRHCENTCAIPDADSRPCPFKLCHEGYFCKSGYVREIETDRCILINDCNVLHNHSQSQSHNNNNKTNT